MIYVTILHLVAGMIVGSIFAVGTLLVLLSSELIFVSLFAFYGSVSLMTSFAVLAALQIGYVAGAFVRGSLEQRAAKQVAERKTRFF